MKKISVIVPVYNREKYIARCLDYLINQTYKNIEIIVIDDGSTDNSASIVKEYAKKYNNIIFIQNKENKKTFETKRIGMEIATGDYIGFCDSDDYIEFEAYEYLLNTIETDNYDIVTADYIINENNWKMSTVKQTHKYLNGELFYNYISSKEAYSMCITLFKNEVIKKSLNDVDYCIKLAHGEDFLWRTIIYYYVKKSFHTNKPIYNYCKNIESVSHSDDTLETHINRCLDYTILLEQLKIFFEKYNIDNSIYTNLSKRFAKTAKQKLYDSKYRENIDIFIDNVSKDLQKGLILSFDTEVNRYKTEINKYKAEIDRYKNDINKYNIIVNRINIADILFSISKDNSYIVFMIIGIKIKIKKEHFVKKVSWWIPVKKWRNNFRTKFK